MVDKIEHEQADIKDNPPPLGIAPREVAILGWASIRKSAIERAILRYFNNGHIEIPVEWIKEYNDLVALLVYANKPGFKTTWTYEVLKEEAKPSNNPLDIQQVFNSYRENQKNEH